MIIGIGTIGEFNFLPPFDIYNGIYEVTATSKLSSFSGGVATYKLAGLTEDDYNKDVANNVTIFTLENSGGKLYVPSNYCKLHPSVNGVEYQGKAIILNLGPIKTDYDLSGLLTDLVTAWVNTKGNGH